MKKRFNKETRSIEYLYADKIWVCGWTLERILNKTK